MTLPIILGAAGCLALLAGLFGGGFKAKEIEVPYISSFPRILSTIVGLVLIGLAILIYPSESAPDNSISPTDSQARITKTYNLSVPANEAWLFTDIALASGQTLKIDASGHINTKGGDPIGDTVSPNGQTNNPPCYTIDSDCLMPGVFWGTLIGRIGNDSTFIVGSKLEMLVLNNGLLYLSINDNSGYFGDNSGSFDVVVSVQ
jgi:hypothetical protein